MFIYYFLIHSPFFPHYPYRIHFHKIIHKHSLNTIQAVNYTIPNMEYIPHELENTYNSIFDSASSKMNQKCQHAKLASHWFQKKKQLRLFYSRHEFQKAQYRVQSISEVLFCRIPQSRRIHLKKASCNNKCCQADMEPCIYARYYQTCEPPGRW